MKRFILLYLILNSGISFAQEETEKFYLGFSYGRSFSVGNFADTDIENVDAGFAENGQKIELFGGVPLDDKITVVAVFRYQSFDTDVDALVNELKEENPGGEFIGSADEWQTYYAMVGLSYGIKLTKKLKFSPRFALGPLFAKNPEITINNPNGTFTQSYSRSSETGFGLGYEIGFGLRNDFGKRFSLMPTFTLSGGFVTINDVTVATDNITVIADFVPEILSFNIGLSLAYRFY
ncbi:MAG: hypothetical protein HC880_02040 [Bacteroidia bacterium]|nr:hypothetical protein [Bacteroidia bacterium]